MNKREKSNTDPAFHQLSEPIYNQIVEEEKIVLIKSLMLIHEKLMIHLVHSVNTPRCCISRYQIQMVGESAELSPGACHQQNPVLEN